MVWNDSPRLNTGDVASRVLVLQGGVDDIMRFRSPDGAGVVGVAGVLSKRGSNQRVLQVLPHRLDCIPETCRPDVPRWGIGFAYGEKPNLLLRTVLVLRAGGGSLRLSLGRSECVNIRLCVVLSLANTSAPRPRGLSFGAHGRSCRGPAR